MRISDWSSDVCSSDLWVTLTNSTGTTFAQANTLLVAGSPSGSGGANARIRRPQPPRGTIVRAGTESGTRERLGDYYLYPLAERTTIANMQTKQVSFLDVHGVPATHGYEYRNAWPGTAEEPESAQTIYRLSHSGQEGLGDQLPAGTLRSYLRDKRGAPQFLGESPISPTPPGSAPYLCTGDAV